jgi:uncharacterized repeat protein (TIGR01451 family)
MRRIGTLLAMIPLLFVAGAAAGSGPLKGSIEAWKVVVADDSGQESFVPAEEASPRDLIEYRLSYANGGESVLQGIAITDPIPSGTRYVAHTASLPEGAAVTFSVDNAKTFHAWPVRIRKVQDGREVWVDATPDMVTHIRWNLDNSLKPSAHVDVTYRAVVR